MKGLGRGGSCMSVLRYAAVRDSIRLSVREGQQQDWQSEGFEK